jgi:hypothetical protein
LRIPWDSVAKLMGEKFSDGAIVQHMSKLRQKMLEMGLAVPPPLKRGTTAVPSKVYATSSAVRRKSAPETPNAASTAVTTPKPRQSGTKKRGRRNSDSDSDSQPDIDDMNLADSSDDGEYGASGRKKKKQGRQAKAKKTAKKPAASDSMEVDNDNVGKVKIEETPAKSQTVESETIQESVETPGPASRTRGVKRDYSKLDQSSDAEEEGEEENVKDQAEDEIEDDADADEEAEGQTVAVAQAEDTKFKSDGEVSPRSKVPSSPATPAHQMVSIYCAVMS